MSRNKVARRIVLTVLASAAAVLLSAVPAFAGQDRAPGESGWKWQAGLTLGMAFPSGAFRENIGHDGFSLDLFAGRRLGNSPFSFGLDCYVMIYGLQSRDEYLSGDIPVEVEVDTTNNVLQGLLYLKCQPRRGRWKPYVEALAGLSYLFTETTISGHEYPYDEITSDTNFDDLTLCAGAGVGLDVHLKGPSMPRRAETRLEFKLRYLLGGRAKYLRDDSIVSENGGFTYLYRESRTNLISAQVGVVINFW